MDNHQMIQADPDCVPIQVWRRAFDGIYGRADFPEYVIANEVSRSIEFLYDACVVTEQDGKFLAEYLWKGMTIGKSEASTRPPDGLRLLYHVSR